MSIHPDGLADVEDLLAIAECRAAGGAQPVGDPPALPEAPGRRARRKATRNTKRAARRGARARQPIRRAVRRVALTSVGLAVAVVGWSVAGALTAPGTDSVAARLAEWTRDHGGTPIINFAERMAYTPPKVGGTPAGGIVVAEAGARSIPGPDANGAGPRLPPHAGPPVPKAGPWLPGTEPATPPPVPSGPRALPDPAAIVPIAADALPDEGVWQVLESSGGQPVLRATFLRADAVYTSYLSGVAWLDTHLLRFELHPGTSEPGGGPWPLGASIPPAARGDVVAAFNSAFRLADARGGYYAGGRTAGTLRDGAATIAFYTDGSVNVGQWGRDVVMGDTLAAARQNLDLIVDDGAVSPRIDDNSGNRWGATLGNDLYVWRSGVGVTATGALVYATGPRLSASSLARLLVRAGAVRAMELDINPQWTTFIHYTSTPEGSVPAKLLPNMNRPATLYDSTSSRDFVVARTR
ncbi:MAG: hypothetical protein ABR511_09625 [Acidimicrobiales bacterium]